MVRFFSQNWEIQSKIRWLGLGAVSSSPDQDAFFIKKSLLCMFFFNGFEGVWKTKFWETVEKILNFRMFKEKEDDTRKVCGTSWWVPVLFLWETYLSGNQWWFNKPNHFFWKWLGLPARLVNICTTIEFVTRGRNTRIMKGTLSLTREDLNVRYSSL